MATAAKRTNITVRTVIIKAMLDGIPVRPSMRQSKSACKKLVKEGLAWQRGNEYFATEDLKRSAVELRAKVRDLRRAKAAITVEGMGKKRTTGKKPPKTPRQQFAARLKELAGERPASYYAPLWGCKPDAVLKYMRGDRTPKLDMWPKIAASFGLENWQDLLPPVE